MRCISDDIATRQASEGERIRRVERAVNVRTRDHESESIMQRVMRVVFSTVTFDVAREPRDNTSYYRLVDANVVCFMIYDHSVDINVDEAMKNRYITVMLDTGVLCEINRSCIDTIV